MNELSDDEVRARLSRVAGGVREGRGAGVEAELEWRGLAVTARSVGGGVGRAALALSSDLAPYADVAARVPVEKLLEHVASCASMRAVVRAGVVALETCVVWEEVDAARADDALRWRLAELYSVACAWRARLGLPAPMEPVGGGGGPETLVSLKRAVRPPPELALRVAAVAFGVAGADGVITTKERDRLRAWLVEVPAFAGLDLNRVVQAIAVLASDPAKALMESARRLDPKARLLAWALANDMAFADGFASEDERRYLANVATVFRLSSDEIATVAAEAQSRAVERETLAPDSPPTRDHGV